MRRQHRPHGAKRSLCCFIMLACLLVLAACGDTSSLEDESSPTSLPTETPPACASGVPGAAEVCNGQDDNCNGQVDEDLEVFTWYRDVDGDGYGSKVDTQVGCSAPAGYVANDTDCLPLNAFVNPGATEICNSVDDDCDGSTDEDFTTAWYQDVDGDGYGGPYIQSGCLQPPGTVADHSDCNDGNRAIYPGALEQCNLQDDDCNGTVDDSTLVWYHDQDADGVGSAEESRIGCAVLEEYSILSGDCDDLSPEVFPGGGEVCNGKDDDCDGAIDEELPELWRPDLDGDGFGDEERFSCEPVDGYVQTRGDCNDQSAAYHPGAADPDDGADQDCGGTDQADPSVGYPDSRFSSIGEALEEGKSGQIIWVGPGTYLEHDLSFQGQDLRLVASHGAAATTIDGQQLGRLFAFVHGETSSAVVQDFTLTHGTASKLPSQGGAMLMLGASPTVRGCRFVANGADDQGGGIYAEDANLQLEHCQFEQHTAENGGAIFLRNTPATLAHCTFADNTAAGDGGSIQAIGSGTLLLASVSFTNSRATHDIAGALEAEGMNLVVTGSSFEDCYAGTNGGAIVAYLANAYVTRSAFKRSSGDYGASIDSVEVGPLQVRETLFDGSEYYVGGGISFGGGPAFVLDSVFSNAVGNSGGGISAGAPLVVRRCRFSGNQFGGGGGGILTYGLLEVTDSVFEDNAGPPNPENLVGGGGIYLYYGNATVRGSRFERNVGDSGGAISGSLATLMLEDSTLQDNSAYRYGGAIYVSSFTGTYSDPTTMTIRDSRFLSNAAESDAGAIYLNKVTLEMSSSDFTLNHAGRSGGALLLMSGSYDFDGVNLMGNRAEQLGGGAELGLSTGRMTNSWVEGNEAAQGGGLATGQLYAENLVVFRNLATAQGGGIYAEVVSPELKQAAVVGNSAKSSGGIYYSQYAYPVLSDSVIAYNPGGNLFAEKLDYLVWKNCSVYNPDGLESNIPMDSSNLSVEPAFLGYDAEGNPTGVRLALDSPLVDAGSAGATDVDGSPLDISAYGGPLGGSWDVDRDGVPAWYWPGAWEEAPDGVDPQAWDCLDGDATGQACLE